MAAALGLDLRPGDVLVSIGTSGVASTVSRTPIADGTGVVTGFADATGGFLPMATTMNAAGILDLQARWLGVDHDDLAALALEAPAGANGVTLLPYYGGERTPNRPDAVGTWTGLTPRTTRADLARAAFEALLCSLADAVDALLATAGDPPRRVLLVGGAARSPAVRALAPAILGRPVLLPPPAEYVALGAARQAAWALSGAAEPPAWPLPDTETLEADPTPAVRERYAALRDHPAPSTTERHAMTIDIPAPTPEDKFSFGLWTVGWQARDPFGDATRPAMDPVYALERLAGIGAYGVNFHDDDLIPFGSDDDTRAAIIERFKKGLADTGLAVTTATTNLFTHPVFKDGGFTNNDRDVRRFAHPQGDAQHRPRRRARRQGLRLLGRPRGRRSTARRRTSPPRSTATRRRSTCSASTSSTSGYDLRFAIEPKPNEPRGDILLPTVGHALAFIESLDRPELVGVNPEIGHEEMAGLNAAAGYAQALWHGKLFHIDLNGQNGPKYDQDLRFGAGNVRGAFWVVDTLLAGGYDGPVHFDYKPARTEDDDGVWASAKACIDNYLILREKVRAFRADPEVQAGAGGGEAPRAGAAHPGRGRVAGRGCSTGRCPTSRRSPPAAPPSSTSTSWRSSTCTGSVAESGRPAAQRRGAAVVDCVRTDPRPGRSSPAAPASPRPRSARSSATWSWPARSAPTSRCAAGIAAARASGSPSPVADTSASASRPTWSTSPRSSSICRVPCDTGSPVRSPTCAGSSGRWPRSPRRWLLCCARRGCTPWGPPSPYRGWSRRTTGPSRGPPTSTSPGPRLQCWSTRPSAGRTASGSATTPTVPRSPSSTTGRGAAPTTCSTSPAPSASAPVWSTDGGWSGAPVGSPARWGTCRSATAGGALRLRPPGVLGGDRSACTRCWRGSGLPELDTPEATARAVADVARRDPVVHAALVEIGVDLGLGLAILTGVLDPAVIVLGGYFGPLGGRHADAGQERARVVARGAAPGAAPTCGRGSWAPSRRRWARPSVRSPRCTTARSRWSEPQPASRACASVTAVARLATGSSKTGSSAISAAPSSTESVPSPGSASRTESRVGASARSASPACTSERSIRKSGRK